MTSLSSLFAQLNYDDRDQQRALVQLLHFTGGFDDKLDAYHNVRLLDSDQADQILENTQLFNTLPEAHEWLKNITQEKFLSRDKNGKRLDYVQTTDQRFPDQYKPAILGLLKKFGLVDTKAPMHAEYDTVGVLGAMQARAEGRIEHLVSLYEKNATRFNRVALLGSNRMLLPEKEREAAVMLIATSLPASSDDEKKKNLSSVNRAFDEADADENFSAAIIHDVIKRNKLKADAIMEKLQMDYQQWPTEIQMLEYVYEKNKERLPESVRDNVILIDAPMVKTSRADENIPQTVSENSKQSTDWLLEGKLRRANTADTLALLKPYLNTHSSSKNLFISNQPYILHQDAQIRDIIGEGYSIETVGRGPQNPKNLSIEHALGSIAKTIYGGYNKLHQQLLNKNIENSGSLNYSKSYRPDAIIKGVIRYITDIYNKNMSHNNSGNNMEINDSGQSYTFDLKGTQSQDGTQQPVKKSLLELITGYYDKITITLHKKDDIKPTTEPAVPISQENQIEEKKPEKKDSFIRRSLNTVTKPFRQLAQKVAASRPYLYIKEKLGNLKERIGDFALRFRRNKSKNHHEGMESVASDQAVASSIYSPTINTHSLLETSRFSDEMSANSSKLPARTLIDPEKFKKNSHQRDSDIPKAIEF